MSECDFSQVQGSRSAAVLKINSIVDFGLEFLRKFQVFFQGLPKATFECI